MIRNFSGFAPKVAPSAYIDPGAHVIGDVVIGERSSIWPGAVLRGDTAPIRIGDEVSIQDNSVLHADIGFPLTVGNRVTVGHLHGASADVADKIAKQLVAEYEKVRKTVVPN
jgi:carbonic anhydrase/acetyltransferase-like protein (isoleucine patch superfamily)